MKENFELLARVRREVVSRPGVRLYESDAATFCKLCSASGVGLVLDPPFDLPGGYEVHRLVDWVSLLALTDGRRVGDVFEQIGRPDRVFVWDGCTSWYTGKAHPLQRHKLALWYSRGKSYDQARARVPAALPSGRLRVSTNSRGRYEKISDGLTTVSDLYVHPITALSGLRQHAKPLGWAASLVGATMAGLSVIDPYCGSGVFADAAVWWGNEYAGCDVDAAALEAYGERGCGQEVFSA